MLACLSLLCVPFNNCQSFFLVPLNMLFIWMASLSIVTLCFSLLHNSWLKTFLRRSPFLTPFVTYCWWFLLCKVWIIVKLKRALQSSILSCTFHYPHPDSIRFSPLCLSFRHIPLLLGPKRLKHKIDDFPTLFWDKFFVSKLSKHWKLKEELVFMIQRSTFL